MRITALIAHLKTSSEMPQSGIRVLSAIGRVCFSHHPFGGWLSSHNNHSIITSRPASNRLREFTQPSMEYSLDRLIKIRLVESFIIESKKNLPWKSYLFPGQI